MANEDGHRQDAKDGRSAIDGKCVGEHAAIKCKGIILFYLICVTLVQHRSGAAMFLHHSSAARGIAVIQNCVVPECHVSTRCIESFRWLVL